MGWEYLQGNAVNLKDWERPELTLLHNQRRSETALSWYLELVQHTMPRTPKRFDAGVPHDPARALAAVMLPATPRRPRILKTARDTEILPALGMGWNTLQIVGYWKQRTTGGRFSDESIYGQV